MIINMMFSIMNLV